MLAVVMLRRCTNLQSLFDALKAMVHIDATHVQILQSGLHSVERVPEVHEIVVDRPHEPGHIEVVGGGDDLCTKMLA